METASVAPSTTANTYDDVPYASYPYPQSHPTRLAVVARLFGMQPQSVNRCRVLELGCASGGNLLPLARAFPESEFIGIDMSKRQIEEGHRHVQSLGLSNLDLRAQSIMDVGEEMGQFDYVICHGVYSWVPAEVREKILAICAERTTEQSVSYISYNTYPGWHLRGTVRDMMCFHIRKYSDSREKVAHARSLLNFLVGVVPKQDEAYARLLRDEFGMLHDKPDSYLLHEHLEAVNEPVYFHQFAEAAAKHGLQYLCESHVASTQLEGFGQQVGQFLRQTASTVVEYEQYLDYLHNRSFRQTLICKQKVQLDRDANPEYLRQLWVASNLAPLKEVAIESDEPAQYRVSGGDMSTPSPLTKTALKILRDMFPRAMRFDDLAAATMRRLGQSTDDPAQVARVSKGLGLDLLQCFIQNAITLLYDEPRLETTSAARPAVNPLTLLQARVGPVVSSMLHHNCRVNALESFLISAADGTRSPAELVDTVMAAIDRGVLSIQVNRSENQDVPVRDLVKTAVETVLRRFSELAIWAYEPAAEPSSQAVEQAAIA